MATKKSRIAKSAAAVAVTLVILLGGTFAWYSVSQEATNESAGIVNVGGRLHDDFNGTNKDVYVENFTNPLNGGQPIYARIRLDEYMEVGPEAGKLNDTGDAFAADRNAQSVVPSAKIDDVNTWTPHVPTVTDDGKCITCQGGETCFIHDYWTWDFEGSTTFMPTFNKDKDSLKADINGTYAGVDGTDNIHYDDYVEYTVDPSGMVFVEGVDTLPVTGKIHQKEDYAYYDDDIDTLENDHASLTGAKRERETHTAKPTADGTVISMADWLKPVDQGGKGGAAGNYWVYDTDGWAYWANPIMPGEATGLLLDSITLTTNPGEKCYYAINVVGQFATAGDWEYFEVENVSTKPTANALTLLETASKAVPKVTVVNADGKISVKPGESVDFNATVAVGATSAAADTDFEWVVLDDALKELDPANTSTTIDQTTGTLTVGMDEKSTTLTVVARSKQYSGAVGVSSVSVDHNITTTDDSTATAYALLTENGTDSDGTTYTLSFVRSNDTITTGVSTYKNSVIYGSYTGIETDYYFVGGGIDNPWWGPHAVVTKVEIVNPIKPLYTADWFLDMKKLTSIEGLEKIDTSELIKSHGMFKGCINLTSLDGVESWTMSSNLDDTLHMFYLCSKIEELDLSNWDVSGVVTMELMFKDCYSLKTLDTTGWTLTSLEKMQQMFEICSNLEEIKGIDAWDTSSVKQMQKMFSGCSSLTSLDLSGWDTSMVTGTYMNGMFNGCSSLTSLDLTDWNTSGVTFMNDMFIGCADLQTIDGLETWDVSSVQNMYNMFANCSSLTSLNIAGWDTSSVITMGNMFGECTNLILNASGWNVNLVTENTAFNQNAPGVTPPANWPAISTAAAE